MALGAWLPPGTCSWCSTVGTAKIAGGGSHTSSATSVEVGRSHQLCSRTQELSPIQTLGCGMLSSTSPDVEASYIRYITRRQGASWLLRFQQMHLGTCHMRVFRCPYMENGRAEPSAARLSSTGLQPSRRAFDRCIMSAFAHIRQDGGRQNRSFQNGSHEETEARTAGRVQTP